MGTIRLTDVRFVTEKQTLKLLGRYSMDHEHVQIAVSDADPPGTESVPARRLNDAEWELLHSPLYAMAVAAGDVVRITNEELGKFEIVRRGGNVCVQFYLAEAQADSEKATNEAKQTIESLIAPLGGRVDAVTAGLVSSTIGVGVGFRAIEAVFQKVTALHAGAQWQYCNVYDPNSGEPLNWWDSY